MHSLHQVSASVLPAVCVGHDSVKGGNRETNQHHVRAHCVNGVLGHDQLHPKLPDDQEAVDAVTRQRDTITRTAADTEVQLPIAQASTAAPPDDERDLFGREEALRIFCFCFGDDSHRRDARHSRHREDRRDAETAHQVCTVPHNLNFKHKQIYHSVCQQVDNSGNKQTESAIPSVKKSTPLATDRHLHPWIQGMRTAVQKDTKFVLQSTAQVRTKRNPTSHHSVHGCCWTIASILNLISPSTIQILHHAKDEATSDIAAPIHGPNIRQATSDVATLHAWTKYRHV